MFGRAATRGIRFFCTVGSKETVSLSVTTNNPNLQSTCTEMHRIINNIQKKSEIEVAPESAGLKDALEHAEKQCSPGGFGQ